MNPALRLLCASTIVMTVGTAAAVAAHQTAPLKVTSRRAVAESRERHSLAGAIPATPRPRPEHRPHQRAGMHG
jgi:hypothetical protein